MRPGLEVRLLSEMDRVFIDSCPPERPVELFALAGEPAAFQVAVFAPGTGDYQEPQAFTLGVRAPAGVDHSVFVVEHVPCDLPAFSEGSRGYLQERPGLFPDVLRPLDGAELHTLAGGWRTLWVELAVTDPNRAGRHVVSVMLHDAGGEVLASREVTLTVAPVLAPELPLVVTQWFWSHSLVEHYGVPAFSSRWWDLVDAYLQEAVRGQCNAVLTPLWTPPVETAVGARLPPCQLLEIELVSGRYRVRFDRLDRWLEICRRHRIRFLELPHLFTQWGAAATPAIDITVEGTVQQVFGWHVAADDPRYRDFLTQVLPLVLNHLRSVWDPDSLLAHVSDEPSGDGIGGYVAATELVADLLEGVPVIDALSDVELYRTGALEHPVVATDALEPFLRAGLHRPWVYYCVAQTQGVANRFLAMRSSWIRAIGHQLFAFDCAGFLHWGYNFWSTRLSRSSVDPFRDTTAGGAYLGGDGFVVYPGPDGPLPSIRGRLLARALWDVRALAALTEVRGRDESLALVDHDGHGGPLRFDAFVEDEAHYEEVRRAVSNALEATDLR